VKVKTIAHIHYLKYDFEVNGRYEVLSFKAGDDSYRTYIGAQEIEIDVPNDYDPRAQQIAALEKQKQNVMAEYQKNVTEINERINKLQALEYTQ
jgi:hypothetical protein